jgi:DNA primase
MAPFVVGRPLALLRCPNGITGEKFFQKHAWKGLNPNIVLIEDPKEKTGAPLISINDLDGLLGLVQSATLEIHPWGSTAADWGTSRHDRHGSRSGRRTSPGRPSPQRPRKCGSGWSTRGLPPS